MRPLRRGLKFWRNGNDKRIKSSDLTIQTYYDKDNDKKIELSSHLTRETYHDNDGRVVHLYSGTIGEGEEHKSKAHIKVTFYLQDRIEPNAFKADELEYNAIFKGSNKSLKTQTPFVECANSRENWRVIIYPHGKGWDCDAANIFIESFARSVGSILKRVY